MIVKSACCRKHNAVGCNARHPDVELLVASRRAAEFLTDFCIVGKEANDVYFALRDAIAQAEGM